ncbi:enoyl-CoA hydratase/isomerase family protein [Mycobacterium sp. NPDC003449]
MTAATTVLLDIADGIGWLRLNRPESLNALSRQLIDDLNSALDQLEREPRCRTIVVTGMGSAFSAGGDLKEFKHHIDSDDADGLLGLIDYTAKALTRLENSPKPVIAAVNGVAVAGGMELLLCCDIVLAAETAMIGDGHARYGVLPGAGGAARLVNKVAPNIAARLLLTGELFPAGHRHFTGLIDEVVPYAELLSRATELAAHMTQLSPLALASIKKVSHEAKGRPASVGLKLELAALENYVGSRDFAEGMAAFSQRRTPKFSGR